MSFLLQLDQFVFFFKESTVRVIELEVDNNDLTIYKVEYCVHRVKLISQL